MTNTVLLLSKIKTNGLKLGYIAKMMGLSYHSLRRKIHGEVSFKAHEIQTLCKLLNITCLKEKEAIFFATNVE